MKKLILTALMTLLTAQTFAKGGSDIGSGGATGNSITCEAIQILASPKKQEKLDLIYQQFTLSPDADGEDTVILPGTNIDVSISEDYSLKGLYSVLVAKGNSPTTDDDGAAMSVLLKKDELIESNDDVLSFSGLTIPEGQKARAYAVVYGTTLSGVSTVALTNKFSKLIDAMNVNLSAPNKIRYSRTMVLQDFISIASNAKVKKLIEKNFSQSEFVATGLNTLCLSGK